MSLARNTVAFLKLAAQELRRIAEDVTPARDNRDFILRISQVADKLAAEATELQLHDEEDRNAPRR